MDQGLSGHAVSPVSVATTVVSKLKEQRFEELSAMFTPQLQSTVTGTFLRDSCIPLGELLGSGTPSATVSTEDYTELNIPVEFEAAKLNLVLPVDSVGHLLGLRFGPDADAQPWKPPSYADPLFFDEEEVTVGLGELAVPGILTIPKSTADLRTGAMVLLGGSGPSDRDGTVGGSKILRDIAWGLATLASILVLRCDKVTLTHWNRVEQMESFTIDDEYLNPALAAVDLLRHHPKVDRARIFILGHSLGGTISPRIAAISEPSSVAGLITMAAAGTSRLDWMAVRQLGYLSSLDPESAEQILPVAQDMERKAKLVDSDELSLSTPVAELPFETGPAYWLDLRGYDPVAVAAGLQLPMLIIHGKRDYQVTEEDDLARWQEGLAGRENVRIRVFDDCNHLFVVGTGKSTPEEYKKAGHVGAEVIAEIVEWLQAVDVGDHGSTAARTT